MKKGKVRSEVSLQQSTSYVQEKENIFVPLDVLNVQVLSLITPNEEPKKYVIKVTFLDQIILNDIIQAVGSRDVVKKKTLARGSMKYDPSDYERMFMLADYPLCVSIKPINYTGSNMSFEQNSVDDTSHSTYRNQKNIDISCCNIDILILFTGEDKLFITKHMEPQVPPTVLTAKSWNNLPQISIDLSVIRNKSNVVHHKVLQQANTMKITLIGFYNTFVPFEDSNTYTAGTRMPMDINNETRNEVVAFNQGSRRPKHFNNTSFYPKWESLRLDQNFTKCDEKFECKLEEIINEFNIDLHHNLNNAANYYIIWGSFHRRLISTNSENWLRQHLRRYNWPFEVHIYNESGGYGFMTFLNLFKLLYPGENVVRLVMPLQWINSESMMRNCGCDLLLAPNDKTSSVQGAVKKSSKGTTDSAPTSASRTEFGAYTRRTDGDEANAFIIVEVKLAKPLNKPVIPPHVTMPEISKMLDEMEEQLTQRQCTGRGQLNKDWQSTVRSAVSSLRRIPYYGMTDIYALNRQLSEARNRVEIITSFWQDAAVYVNNNFVPQQFLNNDNLYEEMLMMAHACLMQTTCDTLVGVYKLDDVDPVVTAARHARQLKDVPHAVDLFLQVISENPRDANAWRELSTCLKEMDADWANVCIDKSMAINPRHPLTLLSKACMVFEDDPDAAEPFFVALLSLYPFWIPMWVAVNAYYLQRQMFHLAQEIMECIVKTSAEGLEEDNKFPRTWEQELGDWWDHTPLLPGTSLYYEAADLLLRLRAISLAEVCIARALCQSGENAAHFHMAALCCRLRKKPADALCHLEVGIEKFGDVSYLRNLEAECHHKLKNIPASIECFEKAGTCSSAYSILLSLLRPDSKRMRTLLIDLIRRQPSAYAWMALADDWMSRNANGECDLGKSDDQTSYLTFAAACAVQALKLDRSASRAWALLAKLVKPNARSQFCKSMATACGYNAPNDLEVHQQDDAESQQSLCHRVGTTLRECRCSMCAHLTF